MPCLVSDSSGPAWVPGRQRAARPLAGDPRRALAYAAGLAGRSPAERQRSRQVFLIDDLIAATAAEKVARKALKKAQAAGKGKKRLTKCVSHRALLGDAIEEHAMKAARLALAKARLEGNVESLAIKVAHSAYLGHGGSRYSALDFRWEVLDHGAL